MTTTQVTIKLSSHAYRCLRRELEDHLSHLQRQYNDNASKWDDQNPDRLAFANRVTQVRELVKDL